jgi:outer membrane receptor protein involved in Fe transport
LKGHDSVLYGIAQPAGIVNLVTKGAQQDRFAYGGATFGCYSLQRYTIDAMRPSDTCRAIVRHSSPRMFS